MKRLLLLLPTRGYRARAFLDAALHLPLALTVASEEPSTMEGFAPGSLLTLKLSQPETAVQAAIEFHRRFPIDAILGVDDSTVEIQSRITEALGLPGNTHRSVASARNKLEMRQRLQTCGIPHPEFFAAAVTENPYEIASRAPYPCVVKPLNLSGSKGVIRADTPEQFVEAFRWVKAILHRLETLGPDSERLLVEAYVDGDEVALEGILVAGKLVTLATFEKPDPLVGPFFAETIYITPPRLSQAIIEVIEEMAAAAVRAIGLRTGPVHVELRLSATGPRVLEVNPRSIGGRCSKTLRFAGGGSLEELVLRQAIGLGFETRLSQEASGVMMLPPPAAGILEGWNGVEEAKRVPGIEDVEMTAHPGQELETLPNESLYLGFIFARGADPDAVATALRSAADRIRFHIRPAPEGNARSLEAARQEG